MQIEWLNTLHGEWEITSIATLDTFTKNLIGHNHIYRIKPKTVTKWRWVMYLTTHKDYYITIDWYTEEEVSKGTDRPICKIEESAREFEE
jgi:hypothetical protein